MTTLTLVVYGDPAQQGSKTQGVTRTGRRYIREDNANELRKWRKAIAAAGAAVLIEPDTNGTRPPLDGPLAASLIFTILRPATAARRSWPHVRPDLDKLIRAVLDALGPKQANLIADDARIVQLDAVKLYPGTTNIDAAALNRPGAWIRIRTLHPEAEQQTLPC